MSQWSQIKQAWKRLMENPQARDFISSPLTKIIALNTGFFVLLLKTLALMEIERSLLIHAGQALIFRPLQYS